MTTGLTKQVAATGEDGRHLYTCPLCEAMCGLEIQVEDGKVAAIRATVTTPGAMGTSARKVRRSAHCTRIPTGSGDR